MSVCRSCQTDNPDESKFCKLCGFRLELSQPKADLKPEEIDAMLADGFRLVHERRLQEALFVADSALQLDPENTSALALKGMCHEELGDVAEAVSAYEQVVLLNPQSPLDRIKLEQLRRRAEPSPEESPASGSRRLLAVSAGVGAALLVVAAGVAVAMNSGRTRSNETETLVASNSQPEAFDFERTAAPGPPPARNPQPAVAAGSEQGAQTPRNDSRRAVGNPMPDVVGPLNLGNVRLELTPDRNALLPNPAAGSTSSSGVRVGPNESDGNVMSAPKDPVTKNENGVVIITEHKASEGSTSRSGTSSEIAYRVGQEQMKAGDYGKAIESFRTSLAGGTKVALTHLLIGRCYAKLGNVGSAKQHFQTALDIAERTGDAGMAGTSRRELDLLG